MNCRSSVASANSSTSSWPIAIQPETPISLPMRLLIYSSVASGIQRAGVAYGMIIVPSGAAVKVVWVG